MNILLWVLAVLCLIGGALAGIGEYGLVGIVSGVVSFAILGGFASAIGLLKEISSNTANMKDRLSSFLQDNIENMNKVKAQESQAKATQVPVSEDKNPNEGEMKNGINPKGEEAVYPIPVEGTTSVKCPKCNAVQPEGRHVCWKCGTPFMY